MSEIEVVDVTTDWTTVRCEMRYSEDLRRFFRGEEFITEYDVPIDHVPERIVVIPVLADLCPVAWANGATVHVPAVDAEYLDALRLPAARSSRCTPHSCKVGRSASGRRYRTSRRTPTGARFCSAAGSTRPRRSCDIVTRTRR